MAFCNNKRLLFVIKLDIAIDDLWPHKIVAIIFDEPGPVVSTSNTTRIHNMRLRVEVGPKGLNKYRGRQLRLPLRKG